jgi:hypothetical protein
MTPRGSKQAPMNLRMIQLSTFWAITLVWSTLFDLAPKAVAGEQGQNLSPVSLEIFDHCLDVALQSRQLSEEEFLNEIKPKIDAYSGSVVGSLRVELEEDFECLVEIPKDYYNPAKTHKRLEMLKSSQFNGRAEGCHWLLGLEGGRATALQCTLHRLSEPANTFQVNAGIFPSRGVVFWLRPMLIFDANGHVRLGN